MQYESGIVKERRSGRLRPFRMDDIERLHGTLRYTSLPQSLVGMLRATVDRRPRHHALVEVGGDRMTYEELWAGAGRVAGGLRALGVAPGDRVAIHLPNGNDWALAFWGVQLAGAVAVPVNTRFTGPEIDYVVSDSGAKVVVDADTRLPDGAPWASDDRGQDDLAAIFYTSGTTGFPKGAMTTHENFLSNCETCERVLGFGPDDDLRNLVSVPLFHVTGCNTQLLGTQRLGGTVVILPSFDVRAFLRTIVDARVNVLMSVPAIYWLAMNHPEFNDVDVSGARWVAYGGAPIAPSIIARLRDSFPNARLGNGFGLTETSSVSTFLPDEFCDIRPESVGLAAPVVELDLYEPDDAGVGELLIRGQNVVTGYWNKPDRTAETFVDGWLHTGDLARIDDDGFVQVVDRAKDMINRGGENVYCVEVENALVAHPAVFDCAVVGVPDEVMGEKVGAVVVLNPDATVAGLDLVDFAAQHLADFKLPQYVEFRTAPLPRNAGGKLLKPLLKEETVWGVPLR